MMTTDVFNAFFTFFATGLVCGFGCGWYYKVKDIRKTLEMAKNNLAESHLILEQAKILRDVWEADNDVSSSDNL